MSAEQLNALAKTQILLANVDRQIHKLPDGEVKTTIQNKFFDLVEYIDGQIEKLDTPTTDNTDKGI